MKAGEIANVKWDKPIIQDGGMGTEEFFQCNGQVRIIDKQNNHDILMPYHWLLDVVLKAFDEIKNKETPII